MEIDDVMRRFKKALTASGPDSFRSPAFFGQWRALVSSASTGPRRYLAAFPNAVNLGHDTLAPAPARH